METGISSEMYKDKIHINKMHWGFGEKILFLKTAPFF